MCFSFRAKPFPWCRQHEVPLAQPAKTADAVTASFRAFSQFSLHIPTEGSFYLSQIRVESPLAAELSLPKGTEKGNDGTSQEVSGPNTFMLLGTSPPASLRCKQPPSADGDSDRVLHTQVRACCATALKKRPPLCGLDGAELEPRALLRSRLYQWCRKPAKKL